MSGRDPIINRLAEQIANGELESQREQTCRHERLSGPPDSGFCLDCGEDIMVQRVEQWLKDNPT